MNAPYPDTLDWAKGDGLLPAIVQDSATGAVLMLGYMDAAAYARTLETGKVTFFSRTRHVLWTKGETSGNTLHLVAVDADCDNDTLLVQARPAGPTCHLGTVSCFAGERDAAGVLARLERTIDDRLRERPEGSYTADLASQGVARVAQKVGEEAVETVLAAVQDIDVELRNEAADLVYHLLILLRVRGLGLSDIAEVLQDRMRG